MTHAVALKTTTHPKTRCRKPYAATQHPVLLMMGVITLLHQVGISSYFMGKMHGQTTLKYVYTQTFLISCTAATG